FRMRERKYCNLVCKISLDTKFVKNFKEKIDDTYRVNMIFDNLPVAIPLPRGDGSLGVWYACGFHVGFKASYAGGDNILKTCNPNTKHYVSDLDAPQEIEEGKEIIFMYDVIFK
ncbi:hypothetical protein KI387_017944, partial [Taxus chinensis]